MAVRCPKTEVTRELLKLVDFPIAAPSANTSGRPSTTTVAHVVEDLDGKVPAVLDGGDCQYGLESTILDLSTDEPCLLRPGAVTREDLEAVLGKIKVDKAVVAPLGAVEKPKAPGMKYRHYAPKAPLTMVRGAADRTAAYIDGMLTDIFVGFKGTDKGTQNMDVQKKPENENDPVMGQGGVCCGCNEMAADRRSDTVKPESGRMIGILCFDEYAAHFEQLQDLDEMKKAGIQLDIVPYGPAESRLEQAHELFDKLREFDKKDVEAIYAQCLDDEGIGMAIVNRLSKAAGFHIIDV